MADRFPQSLLDAIHADEVPSFRRPYDGLGHAPCERSFVVCSVPRTGSTLLCQGLWDLGTAAMPAEYFNDRYIKRLTRRWGCRTLGVRLRLAYRRSRSGHLLRSEKFLRSYIARLLEQRTASYGLFGVKLHHDQHMNELGGMPLHEILPDPRFVYITRENRLRQVVSLARARQTNRFRGSDTSDVVERYDLDLMRSCKRKLEAQERGWEDYFATWGIEPLRVTYEQVVDAYDDTVFAVARHVGAEVPAGVRLPRARLIRQSDGLSEEWTDRLAQDLAAPATEALSP